MDYEFIVGVTKKAMERPIAKAFLYPIDPDALGIPDYPKLIKKPMDLTTVLRKAYNKEYLSIEDWMSDINLIWSNCIKFNGRDSCFGILADQMSKYVANEVRYAFLPEDKWVESVYSLAEELNNLILKSELFSEIKKETDVPTKTEKERAEFALSSSGTYDFDVVFKIIEACRYLNIAHEQKKTELIVFTSSMSSYDIDVITSIIKSAR